MINSAFNADESNSFFKSLELNEDNGHMVLKGGKRVPIGTVRGNYTKTANGWVHRKNLKGNKSESSSSNSSKDKKKDNKNGKSTTIEVDWANDEGLSPEKFAKPYNLKVKKVTDNGPGGGYPVYRFSGSEKDLKSFLENVYGDDDIDTYKVK